MLFHIPKENYFQGTHSMGEMSLFQSSRAETKLIIEKDILGTTKCNRNSNFLFSLPYGKKRP